jgi:hypothetical protein
LLEVKYTIAGNASIKNLRVISLRLSHLHYLGFSSYLFAWPFSQTVCGQHGLSSRTGKIRYSWSPAWPRLSLSVGHITLGRAARGAARRWPGLASACPLVTSQWAASGEGQRVALGSDGRTAMSWPRRRPRAHDLQNGRAEDDYHARAVTTGRRRRGRGGGHAHDLQDGRADGTRASGDGRTATSCRRQPPPPGRPGWTRTTTYDRHAGRPRVHDL